MEARPNTAHDDHRRDDLTRGDGGPILRASGADDRSRRNPGRTTALPRGSGPGFHRESDDVSS